MNACKQAIFAGLAAGILFAVCLFAHADPKSPFMIHSPGFAAAGTAPPPLCSAETAHTGQLCLDPHPSAPVVILKGDGTVTPTPLSAVVVTTCNLAVALFIQLDATHLLRADPRQSDMFTAVDGKMVQSQAGPIPWDDAYKLALKAVLSSHVVIPCMDGPTT